MENLEKLKCEFLGIFSDYITRKGTEQLVDWLETFTDFSRPRPPPNTTGRTLAACWSIA
jgi:hypothetical protein